MDCEQVNKILGRFIDRELPPSEADSMRGHLLSCSVCGRAVRQLRRLGRLLNEDPLPSVPAGFSGTVLTRIENMTANVGNLDLSRPVNGMEPVEVDLPRRAVSPALAPFWAAAVSLGLFGLAVGMAMSSQAVPTQRRAVKQVEFRDTLGVYGFVGSNRVAVGSLTDAYVSLAPPADGNQVPRQVLGKSPIRGHAQPRSVSP